MKSKLHRNGWMDEGRVGWMDRWVDGWREGWVDEWRYGWRDGGIQLPVSDALVT